MKKWLLSSAALAASLVSSPLAAQVTALTGGTVVDLSGKAAIEDAVILIEGERIKAIGPAASTPVPEGATVVPMDGKWIIPGLMNMHVHLGLNLPGAGRLYGEKPEAKSLRMLDNAQKSLMSGVTTIRLTGEEGGVDFAVKNAIDGGTFMGPRIHTAGESIVPTGGHGKLEADGPYAIAKGVREQIKRGATWIKLGISGGISDERGAIAASPFTDEEMKIAIEVAHRNGVKVTGHTGSPQASEYALKQGIDGFEHGYFFTPEILKEMKAKGTWYVPTIVVSQKGALEFYRKIGSPQWYLERQASVGKIHWQTLKSAVKAGVNIALGSDQYPFEPNEGTTATVREAELYQEAGMTPIQALRAATIEPARMLGIAGEVGELRPNLLADIVAVDADPSKDIAALRTICFVMKGGKIARNECAR
ncbi:amidohydrolase family protein [Sphingobium boeckii]|uniref:Imidazolonepropionase-like amidohydrolase n=1 Tax=Sphingobium boeckii TaxID=1082345 RepID=A0A7W9AK24_9SPHN|nr:amidohydrolase family protein [Sphingobium boeckii]MBB5686874.1 imidazolonepropionase-like amidohydrolase [Sphingobium boeckii]